MATICQTLRSALLAQSKFILPDILIGGYYYCFHFTHKEFESQKGWVNHHQLKEREVVYLTSGTPDPGPLITTPLYLPFMDLFFPLSINSSYTLELLGLFCFVLNDK